VGGRPLAWLAAMLAADKDRLIFDIRQKAHMCRAQLPARGRRRSHGVPHPLFVGTRAAEAGARDARLAIQ